MPIYEYQCDKCGATYEEIKAVEERNNSLCPECGKPGNLLLSGGGFDLKGDDWFKSGRS